MAPWKTQISTHTPIDTFTYLQRTLKSIWYCFQSSEAQKMYLQSMILLSLFQLQTDAKKHSAVKHKPNWSNNELKRSEGSSDGANKMETTTKWNHRSSDFSDESERSSMGRKTPTISQTGSWRRGMTAQVGVSSPRTKSTITTNCSSLKTHGNGLDSHVSNPHVFPHLFWNTKQCILIVFIHNMKINGVQKHVCVSKKVSHKGLKWRSKWWPNFHFWDNLFLSLKY